MSSEVGFFSAFQEELEKIAISQKLLMDARIAALHKIDDYQRAAIQADKADLLQFFRRYSPKGNVARDLRDRKKRQARLFGDVAVMRGAEAVGGTRGLWGSFAARRATEDGVEIGRNFRTVVARQASGTLPERENDLLRRARRYGFRNRSKDAT